MMENRALSGLAAVLLAGLAGCATAPAAPPGEPVADPEALEAEFRRETVPESPRRVRFAWSFDEAGSRVRGEGVVRYVAPDRLRLDLFGPRGETYLIAALVGEDFRLPAGAAQGMALPSPALLWGALGVFRLPRGAELASATAKDSLAVLHYRAGDEGFEFRAVRRDGALRLVQVERIGSSGVLETVAVEHGNGRELARTRYRDWAAYRELTFELKDGEDVASFPESIWSPGEGR